MFFKKPQNIVLKKQCTAENYMLGKQTAGLDFCLHALLENFLETTRLALWKYILDHRNTLA